MGAHMSVTTQEIRRAEPTPELVAFAKRQVVHAKIRRGIERRAEPREMIVIPVLVQEVNDDLAPIGEPIDVVTRDLTSRGAGLVHYAPISENKLVLQMCLDNELVNVVSRVAWRKPLGPFFGTGVEFIDRLEEFPQSRESIQREFQMDGSDSYHRASRPSGPRKPRSGM